MKISKLWLDKFFDAPLPSAEVLSDALTFHAFEIDGIDTVVNDAVLDVKVTPNRGHDCLSHRGIAKELSAILQLPLKNDPFTLEYDLSKVADKLDVSMEEEVVKEKLCRRYMAAHISGVKVGPSPDWLKSSLESLGQKSINNIVDATNLVMFNIGQPMHAFDAKKVGKNPNGQYVIEVRKGLTKEAVTDLSGKEHILEPNSLVIGSYDYENLIHGLPSPTFLGIAGVKGGIASGIDSDTTDIILESANFDGVFTRKSAQTLKLRTDASSRYEQDISPQLCGVGMRQAVKLIVELMGGKLEGVVDVYPEPQKPQYANVTVEKVNRVLGTQLTGADVASVFHRLGFAYKEDQGVFEVHIPPERLDIVIPEDLVEEVARIIGYDKITGVQLPQLDKKPEVNKNFAAAEAAREALQNQGYSEVFTSVFADKGERVVLNKVDGVKPYLRATLLPGLTEALAKNKPNKELLGLKEIKLFEVGTVWKDGKEVAMLGTVSEKEKANEMPVVPTEVGAEYANLPLSTADRYQTFSKYPYIVRDIAAWVPEGYDQHIMGTMITEVILPNSQGIAAKISLLDQFAKEGKISIAFRIIFQSFDRTLVETEVNELMEKVSRALKAKGFEIR